MVPGLNVVDQRLDTSRITMSVPAMRACTQCTVAHSGTVCENVRWQSNCLWKKRMDWASWMLNIHTRNRSEPFYKQPSRRTAIKNFGCSRDETGLLRPRRLARLKAINAARVDELMTYKFMMRDFPDYEITSNEKIQSADSRLTKAPRDDGLAHPSPFLQGVKRPSLKPEEEQKISVSVCVGSADWYAELKADVVNVGRNCEEKYEEPEPAAAVPGQLVLPELTEGMLAEVEAALVPAPQDEVLATGFNLVVRRADLVTLNDDQWINDTVINFYMSMLVNRSEEGQIRVYAFNTFFFTKLCRDGHAGLKRWTRKIDLFSYDIILVPIHMNRHWFLGVIDFRKCQIALYDSFGAPHAKSNCIDLLRDYLEQESQHKRNYGINWDAWKLIVADDVPQQQNMSDCGMFTCQFAECISRDAPFQFTQQNMPYFRKRVVYEILHSTLL